MAGSSHERCRIEAEPRSHFADSRITGRFDRPAEGKLRFVFPSRPRVPDSGERARDRTVCPQRSGIGFRATAVHSRLRISCTVATFEYYRTDRHSDQIPAPLSWHLTLQNIIDLREEWNRQCPQSVAIPALLRRSCDRV